MRFDIRYATRFRYQGEVVESHNELRACPAADARQHVLYYDATTIPSSRMHWYYDYWGTRVDAFGIRAPHRELTVMAAASVETAPAPPMSGSARMAQLAAPGFRDAHLEYLGASTHTQWGDALAREARERAALGGDDVVGVALALHRTIGTSYRYEPGATYVGVGVDEVLERRAGVCQDFAHLMIAMCRSVGIPARYASGYFFAVDDAEGHEPAGEEARVETHAWVEVAVPGFGWWGLDPTNQQEVGPRHVKIGHGRDYDDVAPLRGVYTGPNQPEMEVEVHIRRTTQQQQQQQQ